MTDIRFDNLLTSTLKNDTSLAYVLLESLHHLGLAGTELARVQCATLRVKLLKIGGVVLRNTRRIRFLLPDAYPWQDLFW